MPNQPDDMLNLDDVQGPTANFDGTGAEESDIVPEKSTKSSTGFKAAVGTGATAILGGSIWALWFFAKRKKKDED